jgi:hypothetical protein
VNELEAESPPEVKTDDPTVNGLMCFIDRNRECGADCMAFLSEPSESPILGVQQKNCLLIVSAERLGRYASGIVSTLNKMHQKSAAEAADRVRLAQAQVPDPRGKL